MLIVFLAEIPCLLRTMAIQMHNKGIWDVIWGTLAGNALALVMGIGLAKVIQNCWPDEWLTYMEYGASIMFILLGAWLLFNGHD